MTRMALTLSQNVGRVSVFCVTRQALRSNTMRLLMCAYGTLGGLRRKQRASPTLHRIKLRLSKCHSDMTRFALGKSLAMKHMSCITSLNLTRQVGVSRIVAHRLDLFR
jgi:hypothetical protein